MFYCDLLDFFVLEFVASFSKDHWERFWVNTVDMFYEILKTNTMYCYWCGILLPVPKLCFGKYKF